MLSLTSLGLITRNLVKAEIQPNAGLGIRFVLKTGTIIEALNTNIQSTQRNTVLGKDSESLCLTEHFLGACALLHLNHIDVSLSEDELPFGDGSARLWIDLLGQYALEAACPLHSYNLKEEVIIRDEDDPDRYISLSPNDSFKLTYILDMKHPKIGREEFSWSLGQPIEDIAYARTFSSEEENQMLGLSGWVVGYTEDDFSMPLLYADEPARHKALDLIGDLYLSGINPLDIKMHIISHKAGHKLNAKASKYLAESLSGS